jgi:hypothetical protein
MDLTPAARRGRSLDKNNNSSRKKQSDPDADDLHKLDNPWYKSVPSNPKKFNWESMAQKYKPNKIGYIVHYLNNNYTDEDLHNLDSPGYKSFPPNPKKKFNREAMGQKGQAFLKKYYTQ